MMTVEELIVNMPLSRACNLIGIPRRTYYNRKRFTVRIVNTRITDEIVIRIREICSERVTYGYRRIWAMLRNEGIYLNPKTVLSIMKKENLSLEPHRHMNRKGWKKLFHPLGPDPALGNGSDIYSHHKRRNDIPVQRKELFHKGMDWIFLFQDMQQEGCTQFH